MTWKTSGLLGAALVVVLSCGPGKDEAVRLKEGANLDDVQVCEISLACVTETFEDYCSELFFEYGRSPPLCVDRRTICDRLDCVGAGRRCVSFEGIPNQVYCIKE